MAKDGKDKYLDALNQAEAGIAVRDHLKHPDFDDHVMNVLKKNTAFDSHVIDVLKKNTDFDNHVLEVLKRQTGFVSRVLKVLFFSSLFWGWLLLVGIIISLMVVKFPMVAEWICSLVK